MSTPRFGQLRARIDELKQLLPPSEPTGSYSALQVDAVRAFRLLAHAEIEAYLEDVACTTLAEAIARWSKDGKPRLAVGQLVLHLDFRGLSPKWRTGTDRQRIQQAYDRFVNFAQTKNHGVKEHNVLSLLLPIGVGLGNIDPTWLATIDAFGTGRGATAHTAKSVQTPPDRDSDEKTVEQILGGLKLLDNRLATLPGRRILTNSFVWGNTVALELAQLHSS